MENLRNRIDVRLANIENDYLKWPAKPSQYHTKYLTII